MTTDISLQELHQIQLEILRDLTLLSEARFGTLNNKKLSTDLFSYHLKTLQRFGLIDKREDFYLLTTLGKKLVGRMDTDKAEFEKQAKIGVLVFPYRERVGQEGEFLIQMRLKEPYFGYHGFITGKVRYGEKIADGALRELKEEAGLSGTPRLFGIYHKIDLSMEKQVFDDKFFFCFAVTGIKGKLIKKFNGGENRWVVQKEIKNLDKLFPDVLKMIKRFFKNKFEFWEDVYVVEEF